MDNDITWYFSVYDTSRITGYYEIIYIYLIGGSKTYHIFPESYTSVYVYTGIHVYITNHPLLALSSYKINKQSVLYKEKDEEFSIGFDFPGQVVCDLHSEVVLP